MIRLARDIRLIPIVLVATISLLALKVSGIVLDGGYTLAERLQGRGKGDLTVVDPASVPDHTKIVVGDDPSAAPPPRKSWAGDMFNFQDGGRDITGSITKDEKKEDTQLKVSTKPPDPTKIEVGKTSIAVEPGHVVSAGERAILESLQSRRQALDQRARDLDMRESLLKAAEKRVEAKVGELKEMEARIKAAMGERDKAEVDRFKAIITMYETMKAKEAARIFDKLDMKVLIEVATQMNPRAMSAIMAQMTPETAERLTVELASRSAANKTAPDALPKIANKPGT